MSTGKALFGGFLAIIAFFFLMLVFGVGGSSVSLTLKKWFGVANANVETEIRRQSRANVEGAVRQLRRNQNRYYRAEEGSGHRLRLRKQVIETYDRLGPNGQEKVPQDLREFVEKMKEKDLQSSLGPSEMDILQATGYFDDPDTTLAYATSGLAEPTFICESIGYGMSLKDLKANGLQAAPSDVDSAHYVPCHNGDEVYLIKPDIRPA